MGQPGWLVSMSLQRDYQSLFQDGPWSFPAPLSGVPLISHCQTGVPLDSTAAISGRGSGLRATARGNSAFPTCRLVSVPSQLTKAGSSPSGRPRSAGRTKLRGRAGVGGTDTNKPCSAEGTALRAGVRATGQKDRLRQCLEEKINRARISTPYTEFWRVP